MDFSKLVASLISSAAASVEGSPIGSVAVESPPWVPSEVPPGVVLTTSLGLTSLPLGVFPGLFCASTTWSLAADFGVAFTLETFLGCELSPAGPPAGVDVGVEVDEVFAVQSFRRCEELPQLKHRPFISVVS